MESIIALLTLILLEVVLGLDNVIFISIVASRLPAEQQKKARRLGLILAMFLRLGLLGLISIILKLEGDVFRVFSMGISGKDLILIFGGLFLIYKSVMEIHHKLEGEDPNVSETNKKPLSFTQAIFQIMLIDAVFSFDSIITAGGTAKYVEIMIAAVIIAMFIMFTFSPKISAFIHKHPTLKMLALSFLVMIGLSLVIEGWDSEKAHELHLKNYIYFGMAFSFLVELLNMIMRKRMAKNRVVELNEPVLKDKENYSDQAK